MKKMWFFVVIIVAVVYFSACYNDGTINSNDIPKPYTEGSIVGYIKCNNEASGELSFGLFIITKSQDTLLSLNINPDLLNIDVGALEYGAYPFEMLVFTPRPKNNTISFKYRNTKENEVMKVASFLCAQNSMLPGLSFSVDDDIQQIIVTDIENREE